MSNNVLSSQCLTLRSIQMLDPRVPTTPRLRWARKPEDDKKDFIARVPCLVFFVFLLLSCSSPPVDFLTAREKMVEEQIVWRGIRDEKVLSAMKSVPREEFVLQQFKGRAYEDNEIPFSKDDTNNRPFEDALILFSLDLKPTDKVLEVGTGSGLQSATISKIAKDVYSVEIVPEYTKKAQAVIDKLGYDNVHLKTGDGFFGWEEFAPFNAILLSFSPPEIPPKLIEQLVEGGGLIAPVGGSEKFQKWSLYKKKDGRLIHVKELIPATFVPMKGGSKNR